MKANSVHRRTIENVLEPAEARPVQRWLTPVHDAGDTDLRVPGEFLRVAYWAVFAIDLIFIVGTLCWDLGIEMPRGAGQLDLRAESRIAVWYSSGLLLLNSVLATMVAFAPTKDRRRLNPLAHRTAWLAVSCAFAALSIDEILEIHEHTGWWFQNNVMYVEVMFDVYAWVVALLPLIALFVLVVSVLIRQVLSVHRLSRQLATAALGCWIGVIVAEAVEAQMMRLHIYRSVQGTVEEGLEIIGSTLFLLAMCEFLRRRGDDEDTARA